MFIDFDLNSINYLLSSNRTDKLQFIFSGWSFIGGYIGGLIAIFILSIILGAIYVLYKLL